MTSQITALDPKKFILIKGAKVNNLKNIDIAIPKNKLIVITGLSGSGKSSLAFDTLFAEGQRKYVESLSSYARQFFGRMEKPEVTYIKGITPAIAIEQKLSSRNIRSTVGTTTEIYDYLKLLYARIGKTISPISGKEVKKHTVTDVVDYVVSHEEGTRIIITCPFVAKKNRPITEEMQILLNKGYTRVLIKGEIVYIEDFLQHPSEFKEKLEVLIDRVIIAYDDSTKSRLSDSIQTAFFEGDGNCSIIIPEKERKHFSNRFELDNIIFEEPSMNFFSFNNSYGACKKCEGIGKTLGIDRDLVIPDKNLSVYDRAIVPWRGEIMKKWLQSLLIHGTKFDFPIHRSINKLSQKEYDLLWEGNEYFDGLNAFFSYLESRTHKIQYRVMLSRYKGKTICPDCNGTRVRKDASYVKINGKSISELVVISIDSLLKKLQDLKLSKHEKKIAQRILYEITSRLAYIDKVGLGYLTLNRLTSSLSGGEHQRIKLATALGSTLVGSMYILDEPSIGLHPRDTDKLIHVLKSLRDLGNTVIVVEHEEKMMEAADQIIDIGSDAGIYGGEVVFQGTVKDIVKSSADSHTVRYLSHKEQINVPEKRRKWSEKIDVLGAKENNLKNINVSFPLKVMTVVTGVSGSGKSTLVQNILKSGIDKILGEIIGISGKFDGFGGNYQKITHLEFVDQNPIGKSSRSNPITYIKAYDAIRKLFSELPQARYNGLKPAHFSFNINGGRCESCEGEGKIKVEMQFMADLYLTCENCHGKRFKKEILEVCYKNKNISDILDLSVEEALIFFKDKKNIMNKIQSLYDVGLGYIKLGQGGNSLSGGEAQRVKLASFLGKSNKEKTHEQILFIFDEPTTGLHFHDIKKLLDALNALINRGNTVIIIEHNTEIVKNADWIIDLGPEGGDKGGYVCFEGTPEALIKQENNYTAKFLRHKINTMNIIS